MTAGSLSPVLMNALNAADNAVVPSVIADRSHLVETGVPHKGGHLFRLIGSDLQEQHAPRHQAADRPRYDFPVKIKSVKNYIPKEIKGKINFENVSFSYPLRPGSKVFEN